jgi:hypothetical protein
MILRKLLAPKGTALIASKKYYFGCGGGTVELERLLSNDSSLTFKIVRSYSDGKSNVRDIISVSRK